MFAMGYYTNRRFFIIKENRVFVKYIVIYFLVLYIITTQTHVITIMSAIIIYCFCHNWCWIVELPYYTTVTKTPTSIGSYDFSERRTKHGAVFVSVLFT